MTTRHDRRAGSTLTEVLVSLFVMAAGMTALLTLFPLGALKIAQMVKDDRTAQTAGQADATMRMYWQANVVTPTATSNDPVLPTAFGEPNNALGATGVPGPIHPLTGLQLAASQMAGNPNLTVANNGGQPSYPVLVDPLGFLARSGPSLLQERFWVARSSSTGNTFVPRRSLGFTVNPAQALYAPLNFRPFTTADAFGNCSLIEDVAFNTNGEAFYDRATQPPSAAASNSRQGIYNWAALLQRPRFGDRNTATMTILVFDGRPPLLAVTGDETIITPTTWVAPVLNIGPTTREITITIPLRSADLPPLIRRGGWIMDGTIYNAGVVRNANFYRIAGMTETGSTATAVTYNLDLETPLKSDPVAVPVGNRQIYLFAGLSEVFERPPLTADNFVQP